MDVLCVKRKKLLKKAHNGGILQNGYYIYRFKNSTTSDPNRVKLNFPDKINFKRSDKCVVLSNSSIYYKWKNIKSHTETKE